MIFVYQGPNSPNYFKNQIIQQQQVTDKKSSSSSSSISSSLSQTNNLHAGKSNLFNFNQLSPVVSITAANSLSPNYLNSSSIHKEAEPLNNPTIKYNEKSEPIQGYSDPIYNDFDTNLLSAPSILMVILISIYFDFTFI